MFYQKLKSILCYFTKGEIVLWCISVALIMISFFLFDRENYCTLAASFIGVTSLIFIAKGNPVGQVLMVLFSVLYGIISFTFTYWGEMITYLGMTAPMAVFALISWLKNPYNGNKAEVKVNRLRPKEIFFMILLTGVATLVFYYILAAFHTANLIPSTISVTTSFLAVYLTFRRSPFYALGYAANDIVLIVLWTLAAFSDVSYLSVVICFVVFLINDIYGFIKWLKMQRRNISFDEIYDLLAVRIVFKPKADQPEKWQCWNIYSLITDIYSPKPERIRDWVSVPKANGYEALHLTVMGPEGQWFEVQIRSERMDEIAEKGLAAHWKYKNEGESSELDKWLAGIKEILDQPDASALEFLDEFKLNLFAKEIRVFTPKGYMRTLPKGATALDFAYDIHTEIGNTCIGAKVNHKLVPMSHKLTSGDQVEILTSDKQKPQREWLDFVVTAKARTHINATFKKYRKEQIRTGITIFEAVVKKLDLPPTSEPLKKVLTDYNLTNKDDLYVELAKNIITEGDLEKVLKKKAENKFIKYWKLQFLWNGKDGEEKKKNDNDVQLDVNSDFVIAPCCNPIPGDDVVGMNIAGTKVTVHKRSCPEAIRLMASFGDKIVPIKWVSHKLMSFLTVIKMTGIDKPGIVSDITALIAKEGKVNMRMIHFDTRDGIFEGFIHLYVHNTADLNNIVSRISQIQGVESVMRVENEER